MEEESLKTASQKIGDALPFLHNEDLIRSAKDSAILSWIANYPYPTSEHGLFSYLQ